MVFWPVFNLLGTVFGSILEVFLLCVAGYILARRDILDKRTQRQINRLNVSLFTPSLLFSKVAFFLTPGRLRELWIIPIVFVVTTLVSMIVAYIFSRLLRLKRSQRSFAMAAAMFMNSNSLPIALMQSLVYTMKELHWGDDDTKDAMLGRALTYLVLYSTLGMMLRWSYGVHLLSRADETEIEIAPTSGDSTETSPLIPSNPSQVPHYTADQSSRSPTFQGVPLTHNDSLSTLASAMQRPCTPGRLCADPVHGAGRSDPAAHRPGYFHSFPNTPTYPLSDASSESEMMDNENVGLPIGKTPRRRRNRVWHFLRTFAHKVNAFMTVPMWAAAASLVVACVQPLQHALDEHLSPIKAALTAAGNCSIPVTLVVLGAYFYTPEPPQNISSPAANKLSRKLDNEGNKSLFKKIFPFSKWNQRNSCAGGGNPSNASRPGETKTVAVAVLSRMVITPLILLPLLALLLVSDGQQVFDDPVFVLSNVLLITSAPALTLAQITQAASGDAFERLISRTIFWAYCVVTPPSTILSIVVGLLLSRL